MRAKKQTKQTKKRKKIDLHTKKKKRKKKQNKKKQNKIKKKQREREGNLDQEINSGGPQNGPKVRTI